MGTCDNKDGKMVKGIRNKFSRFYYEIRWFAEKTERRNYRIFKLVTCKTISSK